MKNKLHLVFLILVMVLVSCTSQDQPAIQEDGYPVGKVSDNQSEPLYDFDAGYPMDYESLDHQEEYYVSEIAIPSPQEGLAIVHGILQTLSDDTPYLAPSLYLGQILKSDGDPESSLILSSVSIDEDPLAEQAVDGNFVFVDVPPGKYTLFIWTPMNAFLIEDIQTKKPIIINVEADTILNLGTIYVP